MLSPALFNFVCNLLTQWALLAAPVQDGRKECDFRARPNSFVHTREVIHKRPRHSSIA
jgi:hypothetical protein